MSAIEECPVCDGLNPVALVWTRGGLSTACPRCGGGGNPSPEWVPRTDEDARKIAWYLSAHEGRQVYGIRMMSPFDQSGVRLYVFFEPVSATAKSKRYTVQDVVAAQYVTVPSTYRLGDVVGNHTCMYCGEVFDNERDRDEHEDGCNAVA